MNYIQLFACDCTLKQLKHWNVYCGYEQLDFSFGFSKFSVCKRVSPENNHILNGSMKIQIFSALFPPF